MLELLIAAGIAAFPAAECDVGFEIREETRLVLRLRPACPVGYASTQGAVRAILEQSGGAPEVTLAFGRIERYPWLSDLLARQASSSRRWNAAAGRPHDGHENAYVAAALRAMPEFIALFEGWRVAGVSVEKVLIKLDTKLPYDAILWVTLKAGP